MDVDRAESPRPLRVLLIEDSTDDAEIILRELRRGGYEPQHARVETPEGLRTALSDGPWDLVVADYQMPAFSGPRAFVLTREEESDVPFILLSGRIGEEQAFEAVRQGVDDYLMKDHLTRLPSVVHRVLREAEARRKRLQTEKALERSEAILSAVGRAAKRLLMTENWRNEIEGALAWLGAAAQVDRSYLFVNHQGPEGRSVTSQLAEWVAPGIEPQIDNPELQHLDWTAVGFARWEAMLGRGETIHGHVRDLPSSERPLLQVEAIASIAVVPVLVGGAWWGTIGFDVCYEERDWSTPELEALRIAADTLAAAIQRADDRSVLQRQVDRLNALRRIDLAIAGSLDLQVTLGVVLDQVNAQLAVDASCVLLLDRVTHQLDFASARGIRHVDLQQHRLYRRDELVSRAVLERRPVHVPDLMAAEVSTELHAFTEREGFHGYYALPLISKGEVRGVLEIFHRSSLVPTREWREFADMLAGQTAIAIDNAMLFANLTRSNSELRLAYDRTLDGWSRALDLRDNETQGHTERVADLTVDLGRAIGMTEEELVHLRRGALLHDIGKMAVPDAILRKPGPLTEAEWSVMRQHPVLAYELLSPIPFLRPSLDIPYCHHERWDGTGYPRGLRGEEIPLAARVFSVVDVWDAIRSDRPYRAGLPADRARTMIQEGAGTQFDPRIVAAFLELDLLEP
ncbi:MAG: HD domain-containing phosphohydrolase [Gemmatimonadota bacterium]